MLSLALLLAAQFQPQAQPLKAEPPRALAAASRISASEISAHIRFLADDLLEGRKPGTPGSELAVKYIAAQLEAMGLKGGAANGSFFQPVPLVELAGKVPATMNFRAGGQELALSTTGGPKADLVLDPDAHVDLAQVRDAEIVFAGYGIVAPEYGWDDYQDVDVRGKVVVLMNFNPPFAGAGVRLWYGRWDYKYLTAAAHGAVGALVIHTTESAGYPWQVLSSSANGVRIDLPPQPGEKRMQFQGWITDDGARRLFKLAGKELDSMRTGAQQKSFRAQPIGAQTSLEMPIARRTIESTNVLGLLPGTDPALQGEVVMYTAHHDHLGKVMPVPPATDGIYNGALDNASGVATVLAIARAAQSAPPRRSMLFCLVTAEEQGLLGSRFLAQHPPVPAGRIAVDINVDSINKWGLTKDLTMLGLGKSTLDLVVKQVASEQGRRVHGDPHPDRGAFYRSDQFELARIGVPVVAVRGGPTYAGRPLDWGDTQELAFERTDYHQPSDEYHGDWDLAGAVQDARLQLLIGLRVGNAPAMPVWTPGDEFEAARKRAERLGLQQPGVSK